MLGVIFIDMRKIFQILLFLAWTLRCNSQNDTIFASDKETILVKDKYVIWKNKVYNKTDNNGLKNGPWIYFTIDTLRDPFDKNPNNFIEIVYPVWSTGNYLNNHKSGKWTFYDSPYRISAEAVYNADNIVDSITIYSNSIIEFKGTSDKSKWTFVEWDRTSKTYIKPKLEHTLHDFRLYFRLQR
jgi:hypothetical protein